MPLVSEAVWTVLRTWRRGQARQGVAHSTAGQGSAGSGALVGSASGQGLKLHYLGWGRLLLKTSLPLSLEPCHLLAQGSHLAFQLSGVQSGQC